MRDWPRICEAPREALLLRTETAIALAEGSHAECPDPTHHSVDEHLFDGFDMVSALICVPKTREAVRKLLEALG